MLKARPAAGDLELGQAFVDVVWPHVWRAGERPDFVTEAQAMRDRVISLIPPKQADAEIKLGKGGLRDTEFSVQLLQLVHGRADERLRVRGTFAGLRELVAAGYIGRADGAAMGDAYRFQRALEHRVQLRRLRRTHLVPDEPTALDHVARSLGTKADTLVGAWRASTRNVRMLQQRLFFSPLLDAVSHGSNQTARESVRAAGLEFTPVETVAQAVWDAVHGDRLHMIVGRTAQRLAFAARWFPGRLRSQMRRSGLQR
mgnify:CR=1 FL=1